MPDLLVVPAEGLVEIHGTPLVTGSAFYDHGYWSMHFTAVCGENQWWVDWGFALEDGTCYADLPGEGNFHEGWGKSLLDVLELITETSMRRDSPKLDQFESSTCGLEFGSFVSIDSVWPKRFEWPFLPGSCRNAFCDAPTEMRSGFCRDCDKDAMDD